MNVQRLIEKYKNLEGIWNAEGAELARQIFIEDLKQLDEQKPVKVPQFVADYIEFKKENNFHVYGAMRVIEDHHDKRVPEWFYEKNIETFARAWLDGYEVEKEKRYTVVMKETKQPLYYNAGDKKLFFSLGGLATKFTRKQLEDAGFGWVFDCEGIEIEEVE
ncbi:phage protein [Streptococcus pneumoniae]|nr:phage protein [Streptococcus pneumoniae]